LKEAKPEQIEAGHNAPDITVLYCRATEKTG